MSAKRRPQGDGTIRKRVDGRWEGRIIIGHKSNGMPIFKSVFGKTQKATLAELHKLIEQYKGVDLTEDCRMTLGEWLNKWIDGYMIFSIRESTIRDYQSKIKNYIKPHLGSKQIAYLTTADIQKFYNKIKKDGRIREHYLYGKELSNAMVRGIHMVLHQALDVAVRERLIARNPTNGATIPKLAKTEKQILCDAQLEKFLEAIKGEPYWYDLFYVEIMTGLRKGELCGLQWNDIDLDQGKMRVQRSVTTKRGGGVEIGETKTEKGARTMVLPPSVIELLRNRKKSAITKWIFPNPLQPEAPISPSTAYRKLKIILKHAELPQIRFHDLRHTFATHAMQGGVDAKTLSGILGHTNASFTLDTYTHVTRDMQMNASSIVGKMMQRFKIKGDK